MRARDLLAPLSVVMLLFGGAIKALPVVAASVPFDLVLPFAAMVAVGVAVYALSASSGLRIGLPVVGGLVVILGGWATAATSDYASGKRLVAMALTVLAILGTLLLVRSARRQRIWVWLHVLVGVVLIAGNTTDAVGRLGVNTIAAGRASGAALVVLAVLLLTRGLRGVLLPLASLAVAGWLAVSLLATGSRGPVLAAGLAVVAVGAFVSGRGRLVRTILTGAALGLGWLLVNETDNAGAGRIATILTGEASTTASRQGVWSGAIEALPQVPLIGVGWGNFWTVLSPGQMLASGYRQYPHNVLLEVTVEAGWIPGLLVLAFLLAGLSRLRRAATTPYAAALFALAVFFVVNAMVSGDVNDTRAMWAAVAMGWVVARPQVVVSGDAQASKPRARRPALTSLTSVSN